MTLQTLIAVVGIVVSSLVFIAGLLVVRRWDADG